MATAVVDFLDALEKSGLLGSEALDTLRARDDLDSSEQAAKQLLDERLITRFQAKQLLAGRYRGFFIADKYKILEMLGEGGMGRVLLCEHVLMQRLVALKLMQGAIERHPSALDRFLREARAAAALHHQNIAQVFDVDRSERGPYIVMEYVDGVDLHRITAKHGPLPIERAVHYIRQAASGLQHAHEAGLVHRDIKPLNLMLDRGGNVKLLDLGLARFFNADKNDKLTQQHDVSAILGTADFIAPEQALESSTADIRADIYSLGLTLYFLLTNKLPYGPGKAIQKLLWHQVREPEPIQTVRPEVSDELTAVLAQMIRKSPDDRFQTPAEVAKALEPFVPPTIDPPNSEEMPPTLPSTYRLGLSSLRAKSTVSGAATPPPSLGNSSLSVAPSSSGGRSGVRVRPPSDVRPATSPTPKEPAAAPAAMQSPAKSQLDAWFADELADLNPPASPAPTMFPPAAGNLRPPAARQPVGLPAPAARRQPAAAKRSPRELPPWAKKAVIGVGSLVVLGVVIGFVWNREDPTAADMRKYNAILFRSTDQDPNPAPAPAPAPQIILRGGGSTFVQPVMEHWRQLYEQQANVKIEYVPSGSSAGISGVTTKFLDFGCSEAHLNDEQMAAAKGNIVHVPLVLGAVVPTYNLPATGEAKPLRFTGPVLAEIFLGKITKWNDPAIAINNPGVVLPDLPITPVYRNEGSGTTSVWTEYLTKSSAAWKDQVGAGQKVEWPTGVGADKNNGVADTVSRTSGAIGYVEMGFALANGLPVGQVKNAAGNFIAPSIDSVTAAAAGSLREIPDDLRFSLTDAPGHSSYPVVGTAWAILYADQPIDKGRELAAFLQWATTDGQRFARDLHYGPLPPELAERVREKLSRLSIDHPAAN